RRLVSDWSSDVCSSDLSSDRAMHGKGRKSGDKVTDLIFYDDSLVLGDDDGTTLIIVEFKKPSRDNYSFGRANLDPVFQVIETLRSEERRVGKESRCRWC